MKNKHKSSETDNKKLKNKYQFQKEERGPSIEIVENIEEGTKVEGEKNSEESSTIVDKTSEVVGPVIERVKESVGDIADLGKKVIDELTQTTQNYIEKYKNNVEMNKLVKERNKLTFKLGSIGYLRHKVRNIGDENLIRDQNILRLIKDIENKNEQIIELGKKNDEDG
jgi:hypothetical protein